jgi:hypothetical protein
MTVLDEVAGNLIPLRALSARLPNRPTVKTIYGWIGKGVDGVRLPTVRIGGRRFVRRADFDQFCERLSRLDAVVPMETPRQHNRRRDRSIEAAERVLAEDNI